MLSKFRILASLVTGLGVALIVGGLIAPRFLLGDARLPLDLEHTTWTIEDPAGQARGETKPVTRQLHMEIQDPSGPDIASVRVGESILAGSSPNDFDNLVSAGTWTYPMDRKSGAPTQPMEFSSVMVMPPTRVQSDAPWLKFPADVHNTTYDVFDPTLRAAAPAEFVGEGEIAGRTVYRFEQVVEPTNLARAYADPRNTKTQVDAEGNQTRSFLFYSARRELTVDQATGLVVGINEDVDTYYADDGGRRVEDVLRYEGKMDERRSEEMAGQLSTVLSAAQSRAVTYAVIALGVLLVALGLFGALRGQRAR
ncbi:DUF3068 domain-containing protein [Corynebacterium liangguodongii]|uniref:DUF3068 domain-containing protein n=1 Tax=Corynebacterium liangguodongii TaxID=2079535 RepID=A0A2S0WC57_9CORY|nr:DUF3068 domain-containing protein [Corynebacterium liangguodongii]AWB83346.1 DUF3068 domain-containing protein [Corynebacterium liangguodongii]PWC00564.1 DUF3068 domain-containing protein [Corynebacterium liangguodongii]